MRILGIDTGLRSIGWAILETNETNKFVLIDCGYIETSSKDSLEKRLNTIRNEMNHIINKYNPNIAGYERIFYNSKFPTTMKTNMSVGVIAELLYSRKLQPIGFRPQEIKKNLTGKNNCKKEEIKNVLINYIENINYENLNIDHITDAIGIAIYRYHQEININI